jgi:hypothetical protein
MLPGLSAMVAGVTGAGQPGDNMIDVLTSLSLTTNLKLCLDAGDSSSYSSGQSWLDRSGNGYDFYLGADGSATGTDPTFNGAAGGQSAAEYFSFDGGDYFTYDTSNESWMNALHQSSPAWTWLGWVYIPSGSATVGLFGTASSASEVGVAFSYNQSTDKFTLNIYNGSGSAAYSGTTDAFSLPASQWVMSAVSVIPTGTATIRAYTASGTKSDAPVGFLSGASASAASRTMRLGHDTAQALPNGARMNSVVVKQGATLSATAISNIFAATRGKFGV